MAERAAYAAGKAGVIALTRAAAVELSPEGVRVNAICPDMEWREMNPRLAGPGIDLQSSKPEGQAAVGELIVRLCSADGAKWTGQVFDARGERLVF
jgi:3-oxoacyl-[acyl-carrier protein] reductase